jgi:hypothetical protein
MPQLFLRRKNRVVQETWNETGKSFVSSLIRMSTDTSATVCRMSCGNTCTCVGPLSAHGHWCLQGAPRYFIVGGEYQGLNLLAWIGWACVVQRSRVNGLDQ